MTTGNRLIPTITYVGCSEVSTNIPYRPEDNYLNNTNAWESTKDWDQCGRTQPDQDLYNFEIDNYKMFQILNCNGENIKQLLYFLYE